jgi:hypothetical protein
MLRRPRDALPPAVATAPAAAAAATATAPAATAATSLFARPGFIDSERTTIVLLLVQALNGRLGGVVVGHLDKAKSFASPGVAVHYHLSALNRAELGEQFFQAFISDVVAQISDIQSFTHDSAPLRRWTRLDQTNCVE